MLFILIVPLLQLTLHSTNSPLVLWARLDLKDLKEHKVLKVLQGHKDLQVLQGHKDLQVLKELLVHKAQ